MKVYVNSKNEVKDVNSTTDTTLTELIISDEHNPFANWSISKILCHCVKVDANGLVTEYYPYIDTRIIEQLDKSESTITDLELAIVELYELMAAEV